MFDKPKVSHDLDQEMIKGSFYQYEKAFAVLPSIFRNVVDRHAPCKRQSVEITLVLWLNK